MVPFLVSQRLHAQFFHSPIRKGPYPARLSFYSICESRFALFGIYPFSPKVLLGSCAKVKRLRIFEQILLIFTII